MMNGGGEQQVQHHRKKNSQVLTNPPNIIGAHFAKPMSMQPSQQSSTIVYTQVKEKENQRLLNKNPHRFEEVEDKLHKRQQSQMSTQPVVQLMGQQTLQPLTIQNPNSVAMNFKALAKHSNATGTTISTSTTPTSTSMPQSNNISTVNKEASRVRQKRIIQQKPVAKPLLGQPHMNFNTSTVAHTKKLELRMPERSESDQSMVRDNTKEKGRPSINNDKKKIKKKTTETDEFECNQELELTQPIKSGRQPTNATTIGVRPRFQLNTPAVGMFKNLNQPPVTPTRNYEAQIKEFESQQMLYNVQEQAESVVYLSSREAMYTVDPYYIQKRQKNFKWHMRAVLMGWMMEIHAAYFLKRQTYHTSVVITDLFFNKVSDIQKNDLQLVGTAAMYIAAKIEEQVPLEVSKFAASTEWKYPPNQILDMEGKIIRALKWHLNPPTINMWANRIMQQWDIYLEENDYAKTHTLLALKPAVFFKKTDETAFKNYSQIMQLVDCSILDIQTMQYKPKILVLSFLYLVLGKEFGEFHVKDIYNQFPRSSLYMLDHDNNFNDLFRSFVEFAFGILLFDLLPTVQYCATYFILPFVYNPPEPQNNNLEILNMQDYVSFQTYNPNFLATVKRRVRGIQAPSRQ